jgi:osmotically-inducible protein OsmY
MMPESRWNDREGRFEVDREHGLDDDLGYGYDAGRRRESGSGPGPSRSRRGGGEFRRAVEQGGGDIGYGRIQSGADYGSGGQGYRAPGDYGRVGGYDFGGATGDYGVGYRGAASDYGDRRYFERDHDHRHAGPSDRPYGDQRYAYQRQGNVRGEDRSWLDRARDEVSAWMGDHDAQHRREADDRGAHRGRGPKGYRRSDERIRDDVNDRLTDDAWLDASHVEVAVENGDVTLSGTVADRPAKRRAELLAEAVSGVGNVQNNLRVDLGGETSREAGLAGGAGAIVPPIRDPLG